MANNFQRPDLGVATIEVVVLSGGHFEHAGGRPGTVRGCAHGAECG